ncbi:MAG: ABC transporter substrate-binding protein [Candidatus Bathyarchaeia archaeon]
MKTTSVIPIILTAVVFSASAYGSYNWYASASSVIAPITTPTSPPTTEPTLESTPTPTQLPPSTATINPQPTATSTKTSKPPNLQSTVTETAETYVLVFDCYGGEVSVTLPVNRIACINNGFTEIIFALDYGAKIVGRDVYSTYSSIVENITIFCDASGISMEILAELNVDLVIADEVSNDTKAQIESTLGVPVIIDNPSDSDCVGSLVLSLGIILDKESTAESLLNYMNNINNLVATRLSSLQENDKPLVYYEWSDAGRSCSNSGLPHVMMTEAGGRNLAANETLTYPTLSPEYVLERNPDVIIRIITSTTHNQTDFISMRDSLMARTGIRNPIGLLFMAKCFHPTLFSDIDPEALQDEMFMIYVGEHITGTYCYPS